MHTPVQSRTGIGLSGKGVAVGIIDSGIDYTHPDFINTDGTSRILYIWDQTISGFPPAGFKSGTEYTNSQINEALSYTQHTLIVPSIDTIGHVTAVAELPRETGIQTTDWKEVLLPKIIYRTKRK